MIQCSFCSGTQKLQQMCGCWKAVPKEMVLLSRAYRPQVILGKRHGDEHSLLLNQVSEPVLWLPHWQGRERHIPHWLYSLRHVLLLEVAKGKIQVTSETPLTEIGLQDPAPSLDTAQSVGWQRGKCSFVQQESAGSTPVCMAGSTTPKSISC